MAQLKNITVAELTELLAYLEWGNRTFADFPKNFTVPWLLDPNYVPPYRSHGSLVAACASMAVAFIVVVARLLTRLFRGKNRFGLDDWLILPGFVCTITYTALQIWAMKRTCIGRHVYDCDINSFERLYKVGL
jgi:hypothetical protein